MTRIFKLAFAVVLLAATSFASTTVSGTLKASDTSAVSANSTYAEYQLLNCGGYNPIVSSSVVAKAVVDLAADSSGNFSGTLYSNDEISCGGANPTYYRQTFFVNGESISPARSVKLYSGSAFNPATAPICIANVSVSCYLTATAIPVPPSTSTPADILTGSYTFLGNDGFSGSVNFSGSVVAKMLSGVPYCDQYSADVFAGCNTAISSFSPTGIGVSKGTYSTATSLNGDSTSGLNLNGAGGLTAGSAAPTSITYTGTGTPVSLRSTAGAQLTGLQLLWNNASFAGPVVDFSHNGLSGDSSGGVISNFSMYKTGSGAVAPIGISLDKANGITIKDGELANYAVGIQGGSGNGSYSNGNRISGMEFQSSTGSVAIQNPIQGWDIGGSIFELQNSCQILGFTGTNQGLGMNFHGIWTGDSGSSSACTLFDWNGWGSVTGSYLGAHATNDTIFKLHPSASLSAYGNVYAGGNPVFDFTSGGYVDIGPGSSGSGFTTFMTGTPQAGRVFDMSNAHTKYYGAHDFFGAVNFTGSTSAPSFDNTADASYNIPFQCGLTVDETCEFLFRDFHGTNQLLLGKDSSNDFFIADVNGIQRFYINNATNQGTNINGDGNGAVNINGGPNAGTGGLNVYTGGASPTVAFNVSSVGDITFRENSTSTQWGKFTGTLTGQRTYTMPDASGTVVLAATTNAVPVLPASLTTTAATSDSVSITGVTASSHCTIGPTNASAATNVATTYISAKGSGSITVTHTATASMTYDILCTAN